MPRRTPPVSRKVHQNEQAAAGPTPGVSGKSSDVEHGSPRPSSPFAALGLRRTRFSSVPLVDIKHNVDTEEITFPASVELPRRHVTFYSDVDSDSSLSGGGLCSMSDTMESFKDVGGSPTIQPSVRIKHLTRNSDGTSRFPKLDECAHFHYDNVELGPIEVVVCEGDDQGKSPCVGEWWFCVQVTSNGKSWQIRRSLDNFQMLDRQLHRCVYDRKFSLLKEISVQPHQPEDALRTMLTQYLERFSQLAGSLINCGPVLNWLELDNRGNRLIVTDEAAINTPAVAAAYVIKRYASQATDEISLEVGDIISVIDMPPPEESSWWRGKKGFQVGFFPCECVEIIGDKVPQSFKIPKAPAKPVLRKHGKLIAFFRSFLLSRPSRRKLKQSGILKERVFGCDLGEHLMNSGRDIPLVLKCCTEFIEQHGIVDGIYRLSGVTSNIQKLRLAFDEDRVPNLLDEAILQDIHCVASLLKMYFRELPNPLLTFHLYDKFVNAVQADEDMRLLKLRDVVQQLPPPHYRSLEYLMRHLSKVAAHGFQTGMTPKNVAIVWAPNLLRDIENGGVGALHVVGVQAVLTEYLIRYIDIIFSEKMPVFPSPKLNEETPKKTRPKSLAISTPTKLLSLEEARSRALTSNLPGDHQKFIDVGGGEENLPIKYHTVIELPTRRRSVGKSKKSPSGWKSFFSRGWHTTSGRRKNRRGRNERPKIGSPIFSEHSPLVLQDKAITESDVSHTNSKKLRTVKSAETLFPLNLCTAHPNEEYTFIPVEEKQHFEIDPLKDSDMPNASSTKSSLYPKHIRSISHDSYFERNTEFPTDGESELDDSLHVTSSQNMDSNADQSMQSTEAEYHSDDVSDSPSKRSKTAQKQKLLSLETEASSPKLQKLSLKRLYHTLSSPPTEKRKDLSKREKSHEASNKVAAAQRELQSLFDPSLSKSDSRTSDETSSEAPPAQKSTNSVPSDNSVCSSKLPDTSVIPKPDVVSVEINKLAPEMQDSVERKDFDAVCETQASSAADDSDNQMDFSMEATLSESAHVSHLLSFDSQGQFSSVCNPESIDRECSAYPQDSSLMTPESPTGDNVSEIPSSSNSAMSDSNPDLSKQNAPSDFVEQVQNKHPWSDKHSSDKSNAVGNEAASLKLNSDEQLVSQTQQLYIHNDANLKTCTEETAIKDTLTSPLSVEVSPSTGAAQKQLSLDGSFVGDIILSPPESFVDWSTSPGDKGRRDGAAKTLACEIKNSAKSPCARSMERSKTEVHEICPKLVSGIAVSGSFGQELFKANSDLVESQIFNKKRSCSDKVSPISPIEDTKRKFESEIGRLIVRDRQMKLEMEQMKAERQKRRVEASTISEVDKSKNRSEKKTPDSLEFQKSPIKSFEVEKKKQDSEDVLKIVKENADDKKSVDLSSSHECSRYIRIKNKPSVKELLSKFEGQKKTDDYTQRSFGDSFSSGVFSNVQVVNHNFPLTSSKSFASNFDDSNQCSKDNRFSSKEHIFQTECVIRFPHPKTSKLSQVPGEPSKNGSSYRDATYDYVESNSWSSGQHDRCAKGNHSKTTFLSSDNLMTSSHPSSLPSVFRTPLKDRFGTAHTSTSRSNEPPTIPDSLHNGRGLKSRNYSFEHDLPLRKDPDKSACSFSSFTDTFNRANRVTAQMRNEFLTRGLPPEKPPSNGFETLFAQFDTNHFSRSPPANRKKQTTTRQRPKSVPPPICRLSYAASKQSPVLQGSFQTELIPSQTERSQNVPKTTGVSLSNGQESTNASQTYGPPKRVRDRAAIFERSLSFSGPMDKRTFSSCQSHKAQPDSSTR